MNSETQRISRFPSIPRWPEGPGLSAIEPVQLRPHNLLHQEIVITELVAGHKAILAGGRCHDWDERPDQSDEWAAKTGARHGWKTLGLPHTIYAQVMRSGDSSRYRRDPEQDNLLLYAARSGNLILSWDETELIAEALSLVTVPLVFRGKITDRQELDDFLRLAVRQPSLLHGSRAGLVIRQSRSLNAAEFHLNSARVKP